MDQDSQLLHQIYKHGIAQIRHLCMNPEQEVFWLIQGLWLRYEKAQCPSIVFWKDIIPNQTTSKQIFLAIQKRSRGMPLAYVLGEASFYGYDFFVDESVLIPRPETEQIIKIIDDYFDGYKKVFEIGVGTGAVLCVIKLHHQNWIVEGSEISSTSKNIIENNITRHFIHSNPPTFYIHDLIPPHIANIDLIVSNPPYISVKDYDYLPRQVIEYEPYSALFAGEDGTDVIERILQQSSNHLSESGCILLEIGCGMLCLLELLSDRYGFYIKQIFKDVNNMDRHILLGRIT